MFPEGIDDEGKSYAGTSQLDLRVSAVSSLTQNFRACRQKAQRISSMQCAGNHLTGALQGIGDPDLGSVDVLSTEGSFPTACHVRHGRVHDVQLVPSDVPSSCLEQKKLQSLAAETSGSTSTSRPALREERPSTVIQMRLTSRGRSHAHVKSSSARLMDRVRSLGELKANGVSLADLQN